MSVTEDKEGHFTKKQKDPLKRKIHKYTHKLSVLIYTCVSVLTIISPFHPASEHFSVIQNLDNYYPHFSGSCI